MKKFFSKYGVIITIVVAIILFVILSLLFDKKEEVSGVTFDDWYQKTQEEGYFVTVVAADWCSNCQATKPNMEKLQKDYNFNLYWHESTDPDDNSSAALKLADEENYIISAYDLSNNGFSGYPYIFVTKDGEFVGSFDGRSDYARLEEELTKLGVIEEKQVTEE